MPWWLCYPYDPAVAGIFKYTDNYFHLGDNGESFFKNIEFKVLAQYSDHYT